MKITFEDVHSIKDCDKRYRWDRDLRRHKQSKHLDTKFSCDECGKQFAEKRVLNWHKKKHSKAEDKGRLEIKVTTDEEVDETRDVGDAEIVTAPHEPAEETEKNIKIFYLMIKSRKF